MTQGKTRWAAAAILALSLGVGASVWAQTPAATPATAASNSNGRVAIVDIQRILARSVAGAAAREQLEKDKATMQRQLDGHKTERRTMTFDKDIDLTVELTPVSGRPYIRPPVKPTASAKPTATETATTPPPKPTETAPPKPTGIIENNPYKKKP